MKEVLRLIGIFALSALMLVSTAVFAAETYDPVSKEKLESIVYEEVEKLDFSNLGIDNIINGINSTITDTVQNGVNSVVDKLLTLKGLKYLYDLNTANK